MSGLKATIDLLDEAGVFHTGAGWRPEHVAPVVIERDNIKIGFLAYVDKSTNPGTESFPGLLINYFDEKKVITDIHNLRECVDKIVCSVHWGTDYSNFFTPEQQHQAKTLLLEGVDVIMGHHPHTIQPFEILNRKYVFYSLGQLCFGDFVWEGELKALKRKTKLGIVPIFDSDLNLKEIIPTHELKGNFISVSNVNIKRKLDFLLNINNLALKSRLFKYFIVIKESFFDRIFEFCFGYYRNPFKDLMSIKKYRKIAYFFRDFKSAAR